MNSELLTVLITTIGSFLGSVITAWISAQSAKKNPRKSAVPLAHLWCPLNPRFMHDD